MRKLIILGLILCAAVANADIQWFNTAANRIANSDGVTPLTGDTVGYPTQDTSISCFVQLIWAGANETIDAFSVGGTGVSGDDQVVGTTFIANGTWVDGYCNAPGVSVSDVTYDMYYVRAFNTPTADFSSGNSATAPNSGFYGESALWQHGPDAGENYNFDFGGTGDGNNIGWSTDTAIAVPEPSFVALAFIGLLTIRMVRRKKA